MLTESQIYIFFLSMLPVTEVRLSVPLAIVVYHMTVFEALWWGILGNSVAAAIVLYGLYFFGDWIMKHTTFLSRTLGTVLNRARKVFTGKYQAWGLFGLAVFVGIPLPMTGAWTGAAVAYVFGFPKLKALVALIAGIIMAAVIVTGVTVGVDRIFSFFR